MSHLSLATRREIGAGEPQRRNSRRAQRRLDIKNNTDDNVNKKKDGPDESGDEADGEGNSDESGDEADEKGVHSDEVNDEPQEEKISSDKPGDTFNEEDGDCGEERDDHDKEAGNSDTTEKYDKADADKSDQEAIGDMSDSESLYGPDRERSESEESDDDASETEGQLITEYHRRILDDPDLMQLKAEKYQEISSNKKRLMKLARADWTSPIRLGTPVSNQHLAAIRERLDAIQPKTTRTLNPNPK